MREQVKGVLRKLHSNVPHNLYFSPNIVMEMKANMTWVGYVAFMGEIQNAYKILLGKYERNKPFGRLSRRWEDNLNI
jgi:hypothetical protein